MANTPKSDRADSVGTGVPRRDVKLPKSAPCSDDAPEADVLDAVAGPMENSNWSDTPYLAGQFLMELGDGPTWRIYKSRVEIFDLGNSEQLAFYNKLLTNFSDVNGNLKLRASETKWSESLGTWKVLVTIDQIKYRRLVKVKKTP